MDRDLLNHGVDVGNIQVRSAANIINVKKQFGYVLILLTLLIVLLPSFSPITIEL